MESVRRIVVSPNTFGLKINGRNIRPLMVHANAVAREDGCPTTLFYIHALVDHQEFHDAMAHEAATIIKRSGSYPWMGNHVCCIKTVIFNDPATIVFWEDGTKTVVKAENEPFDKEKGLAMAICKRTCGNNGRYFNVFRKYCHNEEPTPEVTEQIEPEIKNEVKKMSTEKD